MEGSVKSERNRVIEERKGERKRGRDREKGTEKNKGSKKEKEREVTRR